MSNEIRLMNLMMDSLKDPFVFVDTDHVIRYMNKSAISRYERWGGAELLGKSIFDCHNEHSCEAILEVLREMQDGGEEKLVTDNAKHRAYMRVVRDEAGQLIGYYERYEPPVE